MHKLLVGIVLMSLFVGLLVDVTEAQGNCRCRRSCRSWEDQAGSCNGWRNKRCCPKDNCICRSICRSWETQNGSCGGWLLPRNCCSS